MIRNAFKLHFVFACEGSGGRLDKKHLAIIVVISLLIITSSFVFMVLNERSTPESYEYIDGIRLSNNTIDLNVNPVVNVSYRSIIDIDIHDGYISSEGGVNWRATHKAFNENYSGEDLSIKLRDSIIKQMISDADVQGENSTILLKAIYVCYHNWTERPNMIPCYAERASLNGTEVWAIAFNSALGYGGSISHEDMWFISIPMIEDGSYLVAPLSPILCWSGSD
ncbi:MAG: hypothetical protein KAS67_04505 [Thermoplasmata archaeon]|nr:hypothetical protein [Thermoplasmata archaeon]